MKIITLILLCLLAFQTQATKNIKASYTFPETSEKIELTEGTGQIKGQVRDAVTQNNINPELNLTANLYYKLPRFGDWAFANSMEVTNGEFTFNELPDGEYAITIRWTPVGYLNQIERGYLPTIWSESGAKELFIGEFNNDNIISLQNENNSSAVNIDLERAAVFEIVHPGYSDYLSNAFAYSRTLNDGRFRQPLYKLNQTTIGNQGQSITNTHFVFALPASDYQFYIEKHQYTSQILGGGNCKFCRNQIHSGDGETIPLIKGLNQSRNIDLDFNRGRVYGSIPNKEGNTYINAISVDTNAYFYGAEQTTDRTKNLITGVNEGYHFLHLKSPSYLGFNYSYLLGGSQCYHQSCQYDEARIFKVDSNTQVPPVLVKQGGAVTGEVVDRLSDNGLLISENPDLNYYAHWLSFYDEYFNLVSDKQVNGQYRVVLPAGRYYVRTGNPEERQSNRGYINHVYPGVACNGQKCDLSQGQLITVIEGQETTGIDFEMNRGYVITGAVIASDSNPEFPVAHARVEVYDEQHNFLMDVDTLKDGTFSLGGLQNGRYYLKTSNGKKYQQAIKHQTAAWGWLDAVYPEVPCPKNQCDLSDGNLVEINGQDVTGIKFELKRTLVITGTIKDKWRGQPIENATVHVHSMSGELLGSYTSDESGWFATNGLSLGLETENFLLTVDGGLLYYNRAVGGEDCIYQACKPEMATPINSADLHMTIELNHKRVVDERFSGMWFNPDESGHGLQFEVFHRGEQKLNVAWFAHEDGKPMWLTGTGMILGNRAFVDLSITDGTDFPASMNAQYWGTLRVTFDDLNHAQLKWDTNFEGFESGKLSVERLTVMSEATESDGLSSDITSCASGSYYDPEQPGEGLFLEIIGEPESNALLTWYGYRGDKQFWVTGSSAIHGDELYAQVYYTQGTGFTPEFDSNAVSTVVWGHIKVKKGMYGDLDVTFIPNFQHAVEFESKTIRLSRLTVISGDDGMCGTI
ncbi:MSCRAMM family protein [Marinicella rhabdoformis]|uniref:MSCRAMM family protein n=1 Tax=Marinicella rhabdoformis TaxID=2580566 RepID=UPI0012AED04F|nr:carboxypeptidase-like regulatory domain-containing protein [Marinicella rhabdoformis]